MLAIFLRILGNWHSLEFRKLRDNIVGALLITAVFVIPGAYLGGISYTLKLIWIEIGMAVTFLMTLRLIRNRAVIAAELSTAANAVLGAGGRGTFGTVVQGVEDYIRFSAALLASQLAALAITLWIPGHRSIFLTLLLLPVAMLFVMLWIWQQGDLMWPKIVKGVAWFTLVMALFGVFFPKMQLMLMERAGRIDSLAADTADGNPLRFFLWAAGAMLILSGLLSMLTGKRVFTVATYSLLVGFSVLLLVDYLAFGGGWTGIEEKLPFGKSPKLVCETDLDRPLPQVVHLNGPKRAAYVKFPRKLNQFAGYNINRDEVEGDLVIDFSDGSRDTWSPGEPRQDGHWKSIPRRLYGRGVATVTIFPKKCEEMEKK